MNITLHLIKILHNNVYQTIQNSMPQLTQALTYKVWIYWDEFGIFWIYLDFFLFIIDFLSKKIKKNRNTSKFFFKFFI